MTTTNPEPRYRHYYGFCEDCGVLVQIEVAPDSGPDVTLPPPGEWEDFGLTCPVCGDTVPGGYDGADDLTVDVERDKRALAEARLRRVQEYASQCAILRMEPSTAGLTKALPPTEREVRAIERIPEEERTEEHRARLREAGR